MYLGIFISVDVFGYFFSVFWGFFGEFWVFLCVFVCFWVFLILLMFLGLFECFWVFLGGVLGVCWCQIMQLNNRLLIDEFF